MATETPPPQPAPAIPAEVVASLPIPGWVKAAILVLPLISGAVSGVLGGGQAAASERAVLASKVERLQSDIDKLGDKLDLLLLPKR